MPPSLCSAPLLPLPPVGVLIWPAKMYFLLPPLIFLVPRSGLRPPAELVMLVPRSSAMVHSFNGVDSLPACRFLFTLDARDVEASEYKLLPR